jgi:hypothetical protein
MATGLSTALNNSRVKADCVHLFAIPQYLVGIRLKPYTNRKEKNMKKAFFFFIVAHQINFMDVLLGGKTRKTERLVLGAPLEYFVVFSLYTFHYIEMLAFCQAKFQILQIYFISTNIIVKHL